MDLGLKDRVAVVAASSQGLGKAVAVGLAREGARLALCARTASRLEETAAEIRRETGVEVFTRALVANAGGPPSKSFTETTMEDWRAATELNLLSTVSFARHVLPPMRERRWGRFLAITSMTVKQPVAGLILSNSVRSAVSGLVKSLSNEYGPYNVLVNSVCPGYTATGRLLELAQKQAREQNVSPAEIEARWAREVPLGRIGRPEEFANLVVFLASERASYITGTAIAVDGGIVKGIY